MEDVGATQPKLSKACDDCRFRKVRCMSKCPDTDPDSHMAGYLTLLLRITQSQCSIMHGMYRETHIDRRIEYDVLIVHRNAMFHATSVVPSNELGRSGARRLRSDQHRRSASTTHRTLRLVRTDLALHVMSFRPHFSSSPWEHIHRSYTLTIYSKTEIQAADAEMNLP
jgi:hypothetical protein